jgi:hypothetical protein
MKIFKSPQKVLILLLSVLIVLSFIMIVRLEGKAASLQSLLDDHHKSLEKNKDILDNLELFSRSIKNNGISIDGNKITLESGSTSLNLLKDEISILSDGELVMGTPNYSIRFYKDGSFVIGDNNGDRRLGYSKSVDKMYMLYNETGLKIGTFKDKTGKNESNGIMLLGPKKDGSKVYISDKRIHLSIRNKELALELNDKKGFIIKQGQSEILLANNKLSIDVDGDINITSKNGNVNIKGKKVNLNE